MLIFTICSALSVGLSQTRERVVQHRSDPLPCDRPSLCWRFDQRARRPAGHFQLCFTASVHWYSDREFKSQLSDCNWYEPFLQNSTACILALASSIAQKSVQLSGQICQKASKSSWLCMVAYDRCGDYQFVFVLCVFKRRELSSWDRTGELLFMIICILLFGRVFFGIRPWPDQKSQSSSLPIFAGDIWLTGQPDAFWTFLCHGRLLFGSALWLFI